MAHLMVKGEVTKITLLMAFLGVQEVAARGLEGVMVVLEVERTQTSLNTAFLNIH